MFAIDPEDPTPLYAQLDRAIRLAIAAGGLAAGEQLPTVRQLAVDLRLNANTVAKVYAELERKGVLETRRGVGTFVRASAEGAAPRGERLRGLAALADRFLNDAAALGFTAGEAVAQLNERLKSRRGSPSDA